MDFGGFEFKLGDRRDVCGGRGRKLAKQKIDRIFLTGLSACAHLITTIMATILSTVSTKP